MRFPYFDIKRIGKFREIHVGTKLEILEHHRIFTFKLGARIVGSGQLVKSCSVGAKSVAWWYRKEAKSVRGRDPQLSWTS